MIRLVFEAIFVSLVIGTAESFLLTLSSSRPERIMYLSILSDVDISGIVRMANLALWKKRYREYAKAETARIVPMTEATELHDESMFSVISANIQFPFNS